jgi:hypothetical protein
MKLIVILPTGLHSMMVRLASIHSGGVVGWSLLLITGMVLLPACRDSFGDHPPVYPVNGKVVVDGKPMNGGTILFEWPAPHFLVHLNKGDCLERLNTSNRMSSLSSMNPRFVTGRTELFGRRVSE